MNKNSPERIYLSPPCMLGGERELLIDAFDSNWIAPLGPHVNQFEIEFAECVGSKYAVALSSGTAALHLALLLNGVERGDTVITASFTFAATANAIMYTGALPVFIDSDRSSWNLDPALVETALRESAATGNLPKAVLAVDILGQSADYKLLSRICNQYDVPIIEDAAEALGATYSGHPAGNFGTIGCFSFNGNKIITSSGGGMLVTDRKDWAEKARFLATQSRDPAPHYEHSEIGYNYRMSNLLAAVGRGQLKHLETHVTRRRAIFEHYQEALGHVDGFEFMPEPAGSRSTRWLSVITIDEEQFGASREDVRLALEAENIESRPAWKPMHLQPVFADCKMYGGEVCEAIFNNGLCLPSGTNLSKSQQERIVNAILSCAS